MSLNSNILITAALPYANGDIHLGHLVEYLQADFWTRYKKMYGGNNIIFLCADDTHGTPIMLSAKKQGITPEDLIARSKERHLKDFTDFHIYFDHYSSTNSETNRSFCYEFYNAMKQAGCIEIKSVAQAYSAQDGMFLPDRFVKGTCPKCKAENQYGDSCDKCGSTYAPLEMINPVSAISGDKVISKESEHVFFKLSQFQDYLKEWVLTKVQPEVAKKLNEWLDGVLQDWDISRDTPYFGFEIPDMENKYFYVWLDAPIGYISATKEWSLANNYNYELFWKNEESQIYHFIGKDIIYFHTLFWPAMLKVANYKTPTKIFTHGFLTINGEKMSKSKGTFINARTYLEHLDPNYLRYYLASKMSGGIDDIDLNLQDFLAKVNSDLIGKITNLGSRSAQMIHKSFDGRLSTIENDGIALVDSTIASKQDILSHYENRDFGKALTLIRDLADEANRYFDHHAPWLQIKENPVLAHCTLTASLNAFKNICIYLKPILPLYVEKVEQLFAIDSFLWNTIDLKLENCLINPYERLLERVTQENIDKIINSDNKS